MGTRTPTTPKRELVIHFTISRSNLSLSNSEKLEIQGNPEIHQFVTWKLWIRLVDMPSALAIAMHLAHSGTSLRFCKDTSELSLALSVDAPEKD